VNALLAAPWDNIASVVKRGETLMALLPTAEEFTVATAATRVRNILRGVKEELPPAPNRADLTTTEEKTLMAFLGTVTPQAEKLIGDGEYVDALDTLAALTGPIGKLFDNVMVMDEDPVKRTARLSLLAMADRLYLRLADFSKLNLE
jgi:glycyl-tRNA synthetase beta chain